MPDYRIATFEIRIPLPDGIILDELRDHIRHQIRSLCGIPGNPLYNLDRNKIKVDNGKASIIIDKPETDNLIITKHAINRYRERTGCKKGDSNIENKLRVLFNGSVEVELIKKYAAITIINHHFKPARYFQCADWIIVVEVIGGKNVLRTIHDGKAKHWQLKY
jgi:hypothetical protein